MNADNYIFSFQIRVDPRQSAFHNENCDVLCQVWTPEQTINQVETF